MSAPSTKSTRSFLVVFQRHFKRYPLMQLDDFHKLAHQAHFGPAHMVPNTNSALEGLHNQVNDLGDGPAELMFDPITPDASVVRIHLRPYLAYGGTLEQLANSLQRTADEFMKSWGLLVVKGLAGRGIEWIRTLHHSQIFQEAYQPAYCVIAKDFWP